MFQGRNGWRLIGALSAFLISTSAFAKVIPLRETQRSTQSPSVTEVISAGSATMTVQFRLNELALSKTKIDAGTFSKVEVDQLELTSEVGKPRLPFYAVTVAAPASALKVEESLGKAVHLNVNRVVPAEPEKCRCEDDQTRAKFRFSEKLYQSPSGYYRVERLGDFRGKEISRILFFPHRYDVSTGKLMVYPDARFTIHDQKGTPLQVEEVLMKSVDVQGAYDYLIVTPSRFVATLESWMQWKTDHQGLRFKTLLTDDLGKSVPALTERIHQEYAQAAFKYALIIGTDEEIPNHTVSTSGSYRTPTDLPFFTMGGAEDYIPDVFAGRLIVETPQELAGILSKFLAYEQNATQSTNGWARAIGVASNEGYNPSDNDYILSIQQKVEEAFGTEFTHLYQNDPQSNPLVFNQTMQKGAMWVTYMGHGSGTSWPSFGKTYDMSDIKDMDNASEVKPIWIDVACQNGGLTKGHAGERLMSERDSKGNPIGTTAFYGGSVNISWHPPAILSRGIAYNLAEAGDQRPLGVIIQAGHVYLSENYSSQAEIRYNQQWYHLQGDPSMQIRAR